MINVIIQGGFGNQLFQYSMGYALAKRLNRKLCLDVSFFDYIVKSGSRCAVRVNNLNRLNINEPHFISEPSTFKMVVFGAKLHKSWMSRLLGFKQHVIWEDVVNCRTYQPKLIKKAERKENVTLYGFWQNTKYFDDYIADLKKQFTPNYELADSVTAIKEKIEQSRASVGIHVRRGDFVGLGWAEDADFYIRAIDIMKNQIEDCSFFIVSDDKAWAKEHFSKVQNAEVVDIKTPNCDIDEFFLLSLCQHQIISESTFGWWAAYLNTNPKRKIIIPSTAKGEMFPESWIRI